MTSAGVLEAPRESFARRPANSSVSPTPGIARASCSPVSSAAASRAVSLGARSSPTEFVMTMMSRSSSRSQSMSNRSLAICQYPPSPGSPITVSVSTIARIWSGVTSNSSAASAIETSPLPIR